MTGDTVGGVWTFTLELAEGLAAHGIDVVLAALGALPSAAQMDEAAAIPNLCLLGSEFRLEWMEDPWRDVEASGRWIMDLEREYTPDVIHLNSFGHGALPWQAPAVLTAHSCVLSWWDAVKRTELPASWNRYRDEVARSLASADLITTPSRAMALALARYYGLDASFSEVVPNGRAAGKFHRGVKSPLILTAGRVWDEAKNVSAVAQAAKGLPWPVCIAGDARDVPLEGCRMLGRLPAAALAEWQARAAIYAAPARYEPFGLSALEAGLSGCALVLGDIESQREIWDDAALFVSPDDTCALRKTLECLIADAGLRETMAQRAYQRALEFDAARMAQRYVDMYRRIVRARSEQCVS
jgi:glycosyltransferase involved in cell wall biosynthesis